MIHFQTGEKMAFKKKAEKPKNPLGLALFIYDDCFKNGIEKVIKNVILGGRLNPRRNLKIFNSLRIDFEKIKEDISKTNLKVDYRSDKARDIIIDMIIDTERIMSELDGENLVGDKNKIDLIKKLQDEIKQKRSLIRGKLKDVESDYI